MRPSFPPPARFAALLLLLGLAACSQEQVNRAVGGSMRSWCNNTPQHCTSAESTVR